PCLGSVVRPSALAIRRTRRRVRTVTGSHPCRSDKGRPADSVIVLRSGQHFYLVGHFIHATGPFRGDFRVHFQTPFEGVTGEIDSASIYSEHDEVEDAVVRKALEHAPYRTDRLL